MSFLPPEAKEPKTKKNYTMPLDEGAHRLRVLSSAVVGYEGWGTDGDKKVATRYEVGAEPETDNNGKAPKYFWAFVVWNYEQERLQIMSVTQKSIRTALQAYVDNDAWGSPQKYDIVVTRTGMKIDDTEYSVVANPHTEVEITISETYAKAGIDLQEWFRGEDPFKKEA